MIWLVELSIKWCVPRLPSLNFEKSLVGASDEWYRRFEQQGWRKKFKQMEQFDAAFKSLIDQIPWKRGDF